MNVLRREEAAERSRLLRVRSYDVQLDAREPRAGTFVDLVAARVESVPDQ